MSLTAVDKRALFLETRRKARELIKDRPEYTGGMCQLMARVGLQVLRAAELDVCVQGGTSFWPRLPDDQITSETDNAIFGFEFDYRRPAQMIHFNHVTGLGALPEMHMWLGMVDTQEVIDFTLWDWPRLCRRMLDCTWRRSDHPDFFWDVADSLPHGARYMPYPGACLMAASLCEVPKVDSKSPVTASN